MAPVTTSEAVANKRKREIDELSKRKRRKQGRTPTKQDVSNGTPLETETASRVNGAESSPSREIMTMDTIKSEVPAEKKGKRQHRPRAQKQVATEANTCKWRISKPIGGRMLNIDPILTEDEKHLVLAYNTSLQVYSASESLLLRKIQLNFSRINGRRDHIAAVCPSATSPDLLWVASYGGSIWLINWSTGDGSEVHLNLDCDRLHDMFVDSVQVGKDLRDILYVSIAKDEAWHIITYDIRDFELAGSKTIFSYTSAIENLRVAHLGSTFAAYADRTIIVGFRQHEALSTLEDLVYEAITFDAADEITCLDIQVTSRVHLNRRSQRETNDMPVVDLAIGCTRGEVFAYNDLLPKFRLLDDVKKRHHALQSRKYHWHRKAVHAVKWSRDGNYILSGGSESTLVLWQLDTLKKDFLPHLSATVENIVVSKRGSAYVLHLDDNSAMILSTAEMKPITYISGIQAMLTPQPISKDSKVKRVGQYTPDRLTSIPAAMSPSNPSQMLLCVGNGQQISYSGSGPSMPLIQSLDLTTMQSMSRQAITRTNPTDVNITSSGYPITEPRVTRMRYSHDGRWLVTTDEWQPPSRDVNSLDGFSSDRREAYLKFWSVSAENETGENGEKSEKGENLELMTRIDAPHHSNQVESVFDLAADPKSDRFATVGGDGIARLWQPTIRQRDGLVIKGKKGRQLYSWNCSQAVPLYGNETTGELDIPNEYFQSSGAVAFSEDGSVLVCAVVHEHGSIVQIIDTESGRIRNSLNGLIKGNVQGISILSTNLVVLSDALMVYDLVLDELRYGVQLRKAKGSEIDDAHGPGASIMNHLATDLQTGRFAVAVSKGKKGSYKVRSELAIFSPDGCEPELVQSFQNPITSLISPPGSSGFLVLDSAAQLWSIAESMDTKSLPVAHSLVDLQLDQEPIANGEASNMPGLILEQDDEQASEDDMDVDMADASDGDTMYPAVVSAQRLTDLFDTAPSFAMPPIEDMFYQVTKLFSAKTIVSET
ncbi:WD40-repeat-containing domain protein [Xylaria arbuscula]|nr:WD40-repeat-containing domain protein [Xylaria arbuscula]